MKFLLNSDAPVAGVTKPFLGLLLLLLLILQPDSAFLNMTNQSGLAVAALEAERAKHPSSEEDGEKHLNLFLFPTKEPNFVAKALNVYFRLLISPL